MATLFYFIVALGILIFVHELGHFLAARFFGVKVETFSIGFGPKLFKFNCCETEFTVSLIPLGGYVKMAGENPDEPSKHPYEFYAKPPWQRTLIALAGPLMNILTAFVFFVVSFNLGRFLPAYQVEIPKVGFVLSEELPFKPGDIVLEVNGRKVKNWKEFNRIIAVNPDADVKVKVKRDGVLKTFTVHVGVDRENGMGTLPLIPAIKPAVGKVIKNSPAERAGLKPGDVILRINGKEILQWEQVVKTIANSKGKTVKLTVLRNGKLIEISVKPEFNRKYGRYTIGIVPKIDLVFVKYPLTEAIRKGIEEIKSQTVLFFSFIYKLLTGKASLKSLGGPILIAQVAGKAAQSGISNFIFFMGFISLQLGYFNLLPLPVLDGGLILMFLIEILRRKSLSPNFRERFQQVGLVILGILMVIVFYNDILRLLNR